MTHGRSTVKNAIADALVAALLIAPIALIAGDRQAQAPASSTPAAAPGGRAGSSPAPVVVSPEVLADKSVVFRLLGPQATEVGVQGMGRREVR